MKKRLFQLLVLGILVFAGCQKELSFESGNTLSEGSLQSDVTGDCLPKTVNGAYVAGTSLAANTNTIVVQVNVTATGSFTVYTDTVNGYYFRATGVFTTIGSNTITLRGNGTPFTSGTNNFVVNYDSTVCDVAVTVLPAGAGGPAVFTLQNTAGTCSATVNGSYGMGIALTSSNTVTLSVNVTSIGTYSISTTATNGMTFSAAGTFATTGVQTITLNGTGTPVASGTNTIPVTAGASTCSFTVTVGGVAVCTLGGAPGTCTPSTLSGSYMQGVALTATNTVQLQVTVTAIGVYSISTNTVSGFSFSGTGNFTTTGIQTVILNGTGTPSITGPVTFTVTAGTSSCTFVVTVVPIDYFPRIANSNWSYEYDDNSVDSFYRKAITPTLSAIGNIYNIFMFNDGTGLDSSGYFRKASTDYFEYFDAGAFIGFDNPQWAEYIFLKDAAASTNWKSPAFTGTYTPPPPDPAQTLTIRFSYTILQKDVSVSITTSKGTVSYPNTIVVEEKYEQLVGATWTDATPAVGYGKSYYARGVGLIKYENFTPAGAVNYQFELRRYQVF